MVHLVNPFLLILAKMVHLVNPGAEWKRNTLKLTEMEGKWESSWQLLLTLFIIATRADRKPAWWQIASLLASAVMVTKTAISSYLRQGREQLSIMEALKTSATLLPLFLTNVAFKVVSLATIAALLRHWVLIV